MRINGFNILVFLQKPRGEKYDFLLSRFLALVLKTNAQKNGDGIQPMPYLHRSSGWMDRYPSSSSRQTDYAWVQKMRTADVLHHDIHLVRMYFFFKQKTAYEISACLVGSEMCIRDRLLQEDQNVEAIYSHPTNTKVCFSPFSLYKLLA